MFKYKADSPYQLTEEQYIDILLLAETKVYTNTAINIKGFQSFYVVRGRNTGAGLCICIRHGLFQSVMNDSCNKAEFITVRLNGNTSNDHNRIILAYSPQENDIQGVIDFYQNLSVQIGRAHLNGDNVILVDDFNDKLGSEIIGGDAYPMSSSGKLLYEFHTKYNLHLLNASDVCTGVLTRIQHCEGKIEKSTIDYLFLSAGLVSGVISVQIDEEKIITLWYIVRGGQKKFTDHCTIKFDLNLKALTHKQTSTFFLNFSQYTNTTGRAIPHLTHRQRHTHTQSYEHKHIHIQINTPISRTSLPWIPPYLYFVPSWTVG